MEQQGRQPQTDQQVDDRRAREHAHRPPARLAQGRDAELQPDGDEGQDQEQRRSLTVAMTGFATAEPTAAT